MRNKNVKTIVLLLLFFVGAPIFSNSQPVDPKIKNIETFTRLYGYVRYFYPGDEAAQIDWTRLAIYGVKRVENAKSKADLQNALEELFLPIAPALVIHDSDKKVNFSIREITPPEIEEMKPVFWQRLGVDTGFKTNYNVYKSVRVNRIKKQESEEPPFGVMFHTIDLKPFRGKEIKMKASVKVLEGKAQLWLRVDRIDNQFGFFDNMDDRPIKSVLWASYEISGPIANDAVTAYFGGILPEKGKFYVDDFQLFVKDGDLWKPIALKNPDFEEDNDGDKPKQWYVSKDNYSIFVTSGAASNGKKCVVFESKNESPVFSGLLFESRPTFGEYISKDLGSGLSCIMPIVLYGTDKQTFPAPKSQTLAYFTTEIDKIDIQNVSANDLYVRLADVVIGWNIFQHFYPYFDVVKTDWKAVLTETFLSAYSDKTNLDFLLTLKKMVASLKDAHGNVYLDDFSKNLRVVPIEFVWVDGEIVINAVYDNALTHIRVGDIVMEIDGVNAKNVLDKKLNYISGATDRCKLFKAFAELILGPKNSTMVLKIKRDSVSSLVTLTYSLDLKKYNDTRLSVAVSSIKIQDGVYYLNLEKISMMEIDKLMPELEKAKSIIFDLRGAPNDNLGIIRNLLKENDTSMAWMKIPRVIYPDYENITYENYGWGLETREPHLNAKIIFIVNSRIYSSAESFMSFIEHYKLATIVGQPTGGTNGNINPFLLPGGYRVVWTGMRVVKHDGTQHHGVGIIPDVLVERTIKGIREGRDEFLEKALEIATQ